jgi:septal ring factor EnvC (AmiA/AmiB activator)
MLRFGNPKAKMDLSDKKARVPSIEQSKEDERHRVIASAIDTLTAVKRLVTEYDRVKDERDNFERQFADTLVENETLRRQIRESKDQRDRLSKALATLTNQMDAIGARCIEAAKMARVQTTDGRSLAERPTMPSSPSAARPQSNDQGPTTSPLTDGRRPAEQPTVSSIAATACEPITFELFSRYLRQ